MAEVIIADRHTGGKGRGTGPIEQLASGFSVGDEVIRRCEPKGRYEETPLRGEILEIRGGAEPRARVRWAEAVRYAGRERGDNRTIVKLSALLPATPENVERAERRLKGRKAAYWTNRAKFYEEMAETREHQGLPKEAEWMRREAAEARERAGAA